MRTTQKFPHLHAEVDAHERAMIAPVRSKYLDVDPTTAPVCTVRLTGHEPSYRTTLADARIPVSDERFFAFGLAGIDWQCKHHAHALDRFGNARCSACDVPLWCASWVADGVFGEGTVEWADAEADRLRVRIETRIRMQRVTVGR